ncbi:MAG: methyltransferase, partial [Bacteroidota bacterium]
SLLEAVRLEGGALAGPVGRGLSGLRWLLSTGEGLPQALAQRWSAVVDAWEAAGLSRVGLLNAYGPTECSDDVTHEVVGDAERQAAAPDASSVLSQVARDAAAVSAAAGTAAIGSALPNTQLYVLGVGALGTGALGAGETGVATNSGVSGVRAVAAQAVVGGEVPVGAVGELYVGGVGVGRGYVGAARATAAAFVPDGLSGAAGARLYRTGDVVRRLGDGRLVYEGREDGQVKVRGHRVEVGEVEAALLGAPGVSSSAVVWSEGGLTGFVVEAIGGDGLDAAGVIANGSISGDGAVDLPELVTPESEADTELVSHWGAIFDDAYAATDARADVDAGVSLRVWIDSFSGKPLPESEILECVEDSVDRILSLKPRHVVEVGCGTGLLLRRVAPHCETYVGTDVSAEAVLELKQMAQSEPTLSHVEIGLGAADEYHVVGSVKPDLIIINEVVQYMPSVEYLARVLTEASRVLAPGGHIFIGGVRSYPLLDLFHFSVQLHRSDAADTLLDVKARADEARRKEKELAVDPAFFQRIATELPELASAEVRLRGGEAVNELTKYRYDVVLGTEPSPQLPHDAVLLDWEQDDLSTTALEEYLGSAPACLVVKHVPNVRIRTEGQARKRFEDLSLSTDASVLVDDAEPHGVNPGALEAVAHEAGYELIAVWEEDPIDGYFSAYLYPIVEGQRRPLVTTTHSAKSGQEAWATLGNLSVVKRNQDDLLSRIRLHLKSRLPSYMVPSSITVLDALPLTSNGKVDRRALQTLLTGGPVNAEGPAQVYEPPRTHLEHSLADTLAGLLDRPRVGRTDDFFALGGHSLMAMQLVAR